MSFSFSRFMNLMRTELYENKDGIKLFASILLGTWTVILLLFFAIPSIGSNEPVYFGIVAHSFFFFPALMIAMVWITGGMFSQFHNQSLFPSQLSIPVSYFEHFLKGWLISYICLPLFVLLLYRFFANVILPLFSFIPFFHLKFDWLGFVFQFDAGHSLVETIYGSLLFFLFINSMFLLASISFKRHPILKAILIFIGVFLVVGFVTVLVLYRMSQHGDMGHLYRQFNLSDLSHTQTSITCFALIGLFYTVTILKIKEKQG